jgi:hypothetical protein
MLRHIYKHLDLLLHKQLLGNRQSTLHMYFDSVLDRKMHNDATDLIDDATRYVYNLEQTLISKCR